MVKEKALEFANETIDDVIKGKTKEAVVKGLAEAFEAGFDYSIQVCKDDGSRSGFDMAYALEDYKEQKNA